MENEKSKTFVTGNKVYDGALLEELIKAYVSLSAHEKRVFNRLKDRQDVADKIENHKKQYGTEKD